MVSLMAFGMVVFAAGPAQASGGAGTLDQSFGKGGVLIPKFGPFGEQAIGVVQQTNGMLDIAVNNVTVSRNTTSPGVLRLQTNGRPDEAFGRDGFAPIGFTTNGAAGLLALQADGKIVVGGNTFSDTGGQDIALGRLTTNGVPDNSFGNHGVIFRDLGSNEIPTDLVVQPDGKILVLSFVVTSTEVEPTVLRYLANGAPDVAFGVGGVASVPTPSNFVGLSRLLLQPNGSIVIVGGIDGDVALWRLLASGALDPSFGAAGLSRIDLSGGQEGAVDAVLLADGSIQVMGTLPPPTLFDPAPVFLARFGPTGVFDTTFGSSGLATFLAPVPLAPTRLLLAQGGSWIIVGSTYLNATADIGLARLTPAGIPDTTFGQSGFAQLDLGKNEYASGAVLQADGKVVTTGYLFNDDFPQPDALITRFLTSTGATLG